MTGAVSPFLSSGSADALRRLAEAESAPLVPDAIERLRGIRSLVALLEADPAPLRAVRDALVAGETWTGIADAAGLKPAAAKWRWQGSDAEIAARRAAGRKRSMRPSSVPPDLPGLSVAETAHKLGVTVQAIYLRIRRGQLRAETVTLPDGRAYKRVFPDE